MESETVEQKVNKIVKMAIHGPHYTASEIERDKTLMDDMGMDSLDVIEVVAGLEDEFGITIPHADEDRFETWTFGQLVEYVEAKVAGRAA